VTILTIQELAEMLRMKPSQVYSLTRARARARMFKPLPIVKVNGNLRFCKESVIEWLKSLEATS
jgi:predicted DNA-binding transcriptional regulator AlpA